MRVLFFAQLKDVTGCAEASWPDAGSLSGEQLWRQLEERWPAIAAHRAVTRLARNNEFVSVQARFEPGDEIALIPPVSGG